MGFRVGGGVMYGWQLESILSRFAARFDHTNHSLAICALPEPTPPLRLMYNFGLIFVEHVRRKCTGVRVCLCVCGTFKICSYRYETAPRTAHKCTRETPEKNAKQKKEKETKTKRKIKSSLA